MFLTNLTHRDWLFDISMNWLDGKTDPGDGVFVSTAFLLENAITAPSVTSILEWAFESHLRGGLRLSRARTKEQVRRFLCNGWRTPTVHARRLFETFAQCPDAFYGTTPVDMLVATGQDDEVLGMVRFKSLWRIADKIARRAASRIRDDVRSLLSEAPQKEFDEAVVEIEPAFADAVEEVSRRFLDGRARFSRDDLRIDDAIGAKLIVDDGECDVIERRLRDHPDVLSLRRSEHHGNYNDVRLVVEIRCPPKSATVDRLRSLDWRIADRRGLTVRTLVDLIPEYVETGADSFFLEILMTTWPELVESEFGRGLHEERIVRMRLDPLSSGRIPTTVHLTSLALLLLSISPSISIKEVPVRLSGRYLPETTLGIVAELFGLDLGSSALFIPPSSVPGP